MKLTIELDREEDGRWIAEVTELSGVMCYGDTREDAIRKVKALALWRLSDMLTHGELPSNFTPLDFSETEAKAA